MIKVCLPLDSNRQLLRMSDFDPGQRPGKFLRWWQLLDKAGLRQFIVGMTTQSLRFDAWTRPGKRHLATCWRCASALAWLTTWPCRGGRDQAADECFQAQGDEQCAHGLREAELAAELQAWLDQAADADAAEDAEHGADQHGDKMPDWPNARRRFGVADKQRRPCRAQG